MHPAVGKQSFVQNTLAHVANEVSNDTAQTCAAIQEGLGSTDPQQVEARRAALAQKLTQASEAIRNEQSHEDLHFVSRIDAVGLFQSVLAKVFCSIPDLQGYGDKNPSWLATILEEVAYDAGTFFKRVYTDVHGNKQSLIHAVLRDLQQLGDSRAPFPPGTAITQPLPEQATIALLADWGGDNDAARRVADVVRRHGLDIGIHLGDIYYGGTKLECDSFLRLWPFQTSGAGVSPKIPGGSSYALNGNHEMFSGGEAYFNTVLPAFGQAQSFFCLENKYWRVIGLDTAYDGGHLKPGQGDDAIAPQWNWLVDLVKNGAKRANIFLTHHQPVSAHQQEFSDSQRLRGEITELLAEDGWGEDAIFGWFFGHEHRCAVYSDSATAFNARLIGNGCIPHEVQKEKASDPGCTPVDFFNRKETFAGSNTAVSSFAELRFNGDELLITYCDEDNCVWGTETWVASKGRMGGTSFVEYDGLRQAARQAGS